jgi:hypothetical protein
MFAKEFIADAALIVLVAWAMTDILGRRTKREQRKPKP